MDKPQKSPLHSKPSSASPHAPFSSGRNRIPLAKPSRGSMHFGASKTLRGFGGKKLDRPHHSRGSNRAGALNAKKIESVIPELAPDNIRTVPLGGVEQIGQNMSMVEIGDDIIV